MGKEPETRSDSQEELTEDVLGTVQRQDYVEFRAEMGEDGDDSNCCLQSRCETLGKFFNFPPSQQGGCHELHFSDEETKARRDEAAC